MSFDTIFSYMDNLRFLIGVDKTSTCISKFLINHQRRELWIGIKGLQYQLQNLGPTQAPVQFVITSSF